MAITDYFPMLSGLLPKQLRPPAPRYATPSGSPVAGLVAEFGDVSSVCRAGESVRDAGYTKWDLHSPFPIHGAEQVMGMKRTKLPLAVGVIGLSAAGLGWLMQWWMSINYPIVVQGKPPHAWQPFVPIIFESGVLISAFAALIGMLSLNGLPRPHHPLFNHEPFLDASNDRFFIYIEALDPKFDPQKTRDLLTKGGASRVDLVEDL
ncbi:MAG: DUF3341 domain-containing protein [Phycisphaeraceae bacterium]|nr:DUF3341 domain-containing protein [Phycisphaeraceae bacterium]